MSSNTITASGWRYARSGPIATVLKHETSFKVPVTAGNAIVKVIAAPLHRTDSALINGSALGRKRVTLDAFPRIGGSEGVGVVTSIGSPAAAGSGGDAVKEGDVVWVSPLHGTWATTIAVPASALHPIKKQHIPLAVHASNYLMAQQLVEGYVRLRKGSVILQNGGSSATSLAVSALCKRRGVHVLTAASVGDRYSDAVKRHEAYGSKVYAYNGKGARDIAKEIGASQQGAALYLNGVGGPYFDTFMKLLALNGDVVTYGAQNGVGLMVSGSNFIFKNANMQGCFFPAFFSALSYAERQQRLDAVLQELTEEKLSYPHVVAKSLDKLPSLWDDVFVKGGRKGILQLSDEFGNW